MKGYRLSPAAEVDLEDIWNYTVDNWSLDQGERYVSQLFDSFVAVSENRGLGQRIDWLMRDYRRVRCGRHLIFYVEADDGTVDVIRILHEKADVSRHLPEQSKKPPDLSARRLSPYAPA